jgi:hypothetical protein
MPSRARPRVGRTPPPRHPSRCSTTSSDRDRPRWAADGACRHRERRPRPCT